MGLFDKISNWFNEQERILDEKLKEENVKNRLYTEYLDNKNKQRLAPVETPAYKRLLNLFRTLSDLSSSVKEFKMLDKSSYGTLYSVKTNLGERWMVREAWEYKFYNVKPTKTDSRYHPTVSQWTFFEGDYLYLIKICPYSKNVYVRPCLTEKSPMTEEQIYNSVVEIENILGSYDFVRASDEHEHHMKKFLKRFE